MDLLIALLIKKILDWPVGTAEGIIFMFLCFLIFGVALLAICFAIDRLFLPQKHVLCDVICKDIIKVSPMQITTGQPGSMLNYFLLLNHEGNPVPVRVSEQRYNNVKTGSEVNTICRRGRLFGVTTIRVI